MEEGEKGGRETEKGNVLMRNGKKKKRLRSEGRKESLEMKEMLRKWENVLH